MKRKIAIMRFAISRFQLLLKDRGFKYAFKKAFEKRNQLFSMLMVKNQKRKNNKRLIDRKKNALDNNFKCDKGLVSVIIPIYDRTWELKEAIQSILDQSYEKTELILICDGSPQETINIVDEYQSNDKVKIFKYPTSSGNAVRGRNKGIKEANGEFIAFLDSDDIADVNRLKNSVSFLNDNKNYAGVYGAWEALLDGSRKIDGIKNGMVVHSPDGTLRDHLKICIPCQSTVMIRRQVLEAVGGINCNMKYREDHELWARLMYHGFQLKSLDEVLVKLRLHSGNNELNFTHDKGIDEWSRKLLEEYNTRVTSRKKICWLVAGLGISGGLAVILKHANHLLGKGHDVSLITLGDVQKIEWTHNDVPIYSIKDEYALKKIDLLIATAWNTEPYLEEIDTKRRLYFVQSDERRFIDEKSLKRAIGEGYGQNYEYFTEAFWIQKMFHEEFNVPAFYVPNGVDREMFKPSKPLDPKGKRKRVLIEGPIDIPFKAVEDCYNAIKDLDCEIWIVSSAGKPKPGWRYDRFFEKVPQSMMASIYSSCDIFIKMSRIEGFFGPPLEAMACGCVPVVGKVTGWDEYIIDGYNALAVDLKDVAAAKNAVKKLMEDSTLYERLLENGNETAKNWPWTKSFERIEMLIGD